MTSGLGRIFIYIETSWNNIRSFAFRNRSIFEIFFIIIYALIQTVLIISSYVFEQHISLIVSLFAIAVLTTFALHKLVMESRIKILERKVTELVSYNERITAEANELNESYNEVIGMFDQYKTQDLNISKSINYLKEGENDN